MKVHESQMPFVVSSDCFSLDEGNLFVYDHITKLLNFPINRIFMITGVDRSFIRGNHAHRECWQALLATSGSVFVNWENAISNGELALESSNTMLIVPPMNWIVLSKFESLATSVLVLASDSFEANDYIRDKNEFRNVLRSPKI